MILVVTNNRDLTTDYVVLELQKRNLKYFRLNAETLPHAIVDWPAGSPRGWRLSINGFMLAEHDVKGAYFRRPGLPTLSTTRIEGHERRYCEGEWSGLLTAIYTTLEDRWLNSPFKISLAENKPHQLYVASAVGLRVPPTLISNDRDLIIHFAEKHGIVGKALRTAVIALDTPDERAIFTTRLEPGSLPMDEGPYSVAPAIFQKEIIKDKDIRVTVVGENVFSTAILSQERSETRTDWRRGSYPDLPHLIHDLPSDIRDKCVAVAQKLQLRFAAIDLVLDTDGTYWFLEANPNGQWAWIETRTGLPITAAIVDELVRISTSPEATERRS